MEGTTNEIEKNAGRILSIALLLVFALTTFGVEAAAMVEMSRNVQSGNTQNLKSSAASDQAAVCACAHSRYFAGGSPSGLRV